MPPRLPFASRAHLKKSRTLVVVEVGHRVLVLRHPQGGSSMQTLADKALSSTSKSRQRRLDPAPCSEGLRRLVQWKHSFGILGLGDFLGLNSTFVCSRASCNLVIRVSRYSRGTLVRRKALPEVHHRIGLGGAKPQITPPNSCILRLPTLGHSHSQ